MCQFYVSIEHLRLTWFTNWANDKGCVLLDFMWPNFLINARETRIIQITFIPFFESNYFGCGNWNYLSASGVNPPRIVQHYFNDFWPSSAPWSKVGVDGSYQPIFSDELSSLMTQVIKRVCVDLSTGQGNSCPGTRDKNRPCPGIPGRDGTE